ncbi:AraC family transcriptional regulator [Virgisporangium aliadipatigenens]|uniref:AraC family transcriptional regulator n=1 Tax=Virgisporangium aliadipatigenens TaxID=741659 RepID=A0A8J4DQ66_9ACTN|nr:helix-turn-helix transcriptional regulator [Virgisporangium aliadipatigenens]GIJ45102.1 AraC family transcriptional regulator [Virgisporangium aliadipatigenens]
MHLHSVPARAGGPPCETAAARPDPRLRPYVIGYSTFHAAGSGPLPHRLLPLNVTCAIVDLDGAARIVTGPRRAHAVLEETGWRHGITIGLTPLGTATLLGVPARDLVDGTAGLDEVLRVDLVDRLASVSDPASRFAVLDRLLAARLPDGPPADGPVWQAWRMLQRPAPGSPSPDPGPHGGDPDATAGGRARVGDVAARLGVRRRWLAAAFRREVGLSPGTVARIARFQRAVHGLTRGLDLARIAAECGYADQAHFQREVRALSGLTPARLRAFVQYREPARP